MTDSYAGYLRPVTEKGKRLSEAVTIAILSGGRGRWIAARLSDGKTDGKIYDRKSDAVRHQLHETQCAYVQVPMVGDMPENEASQFLEVAERLYRAGYRLSDPDTTPMVTNDTARSVRNSLRRQQTRERNTRR